jgi:glycerol-3-phosphate acyltransferase PlsX
LLLVGAPAVLAGFSHPRARIVPASEVVGMDDPIEVALRKKKDSSMRVAIAQVKDGAAQAAVSAGNTGALMAIARYLLKTLDGIDRPAIAPQLPNVKGVPPLCWTWVPTWIAMPKTCCSSPCLVPP